MVFHERDRYQRILGKVLVNGADAGYVRAEEKARAERRGLKRDPKRMRCRSTIR